MNAGKSESLYYLSIERVLKALAEAERVYAAARLKADRASMEYLRKARKP